MESICVGYIQKWTLLQQVVLTTRQLIYGKPNHCCVMKILKLNETGLVKWLYALSVYSLCNWCPQPTQYAATAGSGTACTWGWDYPQFIIPNVWQSQSVAKQSLVILIGLSLIDRCCQQSNNDDVPQSMVLLLDIHDKNNRCSVAIGCMEANNENSVHCIGHWSAFTKGLQ